MIKKTTSYRYLIITVFSSAILVVIVSALLSMYQPTEQSSVATQQTDEKLALKGAMNAREPSMTQKKILESVRATRGATGGPAPAQPGCNLYASIAAKQVGEMTTYSVSVSSTGTETCNNVSYSVYYPEGEQYKSAVPKPSASDYYWVLGTMKPEDTRTTTLTTTRLNSDTALEMCATADNAVSDACTHAIVSTATTVTTASDTAPVEKTTTTTLSKAVSYTTPTGKEYGIWVWDSPLSMSSQKMDTIIVKTKATGINVIYLTIDDVLTTKDKARFTKALAAFVQKANAQGIAVDAVAGARDWAKPANRWKGYTVIDYVKEYNKTNPKLRGFQYDVEPYLLPEYEGNKAPVLNDFVAFIDASATLLSGSGVRFAVVIPHFYDSTQAWTPKTTLNGVSDYTYTHLLRILNRNPNSTIIVMAYRNYFEGEGGIREIVTPEIEQAGSTKVIVAQETGNVEPDFVTFYGHTKNDLFAALTTIQTTFKNKAGFGGVAVHYFDPFVNLR